MMVLKIFRLSTYNLTKPISQVRIRIFDSKGRKVRSIANNELVGPLEQLYLMV